MFGTFGHRIDNTVMILPIVQDKILCTLNDTYVGARNDGVRAPASRERHA